ncbi:hypothetical protein KKF17_03370 [Patescibacteria group bacterium]|nr:hypothetical protein [Patescibacteria group bacterium]
MAHKLETSVRANAVLIPMKADFEAMNRLRRDGSLQALCNLPCGQPCTCSCHVCGQEKEERSFRF